MKWVGGSSGQREPGKTQRESVRYRRPVSLSVRPALVINETTNLEAKFLLAAEQKKTGGSPSLRKLKR